VRAGRSSWFFAWMGVGVAYVVGVFAALSFGIVALAVAVVATIALSSRPEARGGLAGIISGSGVGLLWVAYVDRAGPGLECAPTSAGGRYCVETWNPWPWLVIGLGLLAAGWLLSRRSLGR